MWLYQCLAKPGALNRVNWVPWQLQTKQSQHPHYLLFLNFLFSAGSALYTDTGCTFTAAASKDLAVSWHPCSERFAQQLPKPCQHKINSNCISLIEDSTALAASVISLSKKPISTIYRQSPLKPHSEQCIILTLGQSFGNLLCNYL